MSASQADFVQSIISQIGYNSKQELIEKLFIQSLSDSHHRIDKTIGNENEIRDRFVKDLYQTDSKIKKWLQKKYIDVIWENWVFTPDFELARTDIAFKLTGLHFILECKRLKSADKAYIDEGVERFITLKYAKGDEYAGMIGFVISGDKHAISKGLQWKIKALAHTQSIEKTSKPFFNSIHNRNDTSQIELYHLFFDFVISST
ncbi:MULTISPECIES: hypothetical protein [unclassified Imperialibacter]|uniref:hypothetical protein n=1 Tax=unclassified Imperialibacter TaxID=2629706 RepID=UPI00125618F4|nr:MULTISPECIES: hypothetical protein [unclassified Imperialibacter]CAD5283216.1 conserved hypothetical protein [Imperialibacter sp. 89]CAD5286357.1 conserved hypothetical protein [Imperialibacter sp. 75]VVT29903.1 conserved hypothetical protein [Imperialibacter sp. EC-SDR9]